MIISGYGVVLERLKSADLELVRQKRNSPEVQEYMSFREEITPVQQQIWFTRIDNENNNYFVIRDGEKKIGLISGADIDWTAMTTGNGGMFFWDNSYWGTMFPIAAAVLLTDISFLLGFRKTQIRILRDNHRAIIFNQRLGYKLLNGQEELTNQIYELTEADYVESTRELKLKLAENVDSKISCVIDDQDHPASKNIIHIYNRLPESSQSKLLFSVVSKADSQIRFPQK